MSALTVDVRDGAVRFAVRVVPRASRTEIAGVHGDALKVRVQAPPVEGAANEALVEFLASALHVARGAVRIVSGGSSRRKVVEVHGIDAGTVTQLATEG